jgi:hypothetical protein
VRVRLASDHKYLRICDLCKELASISKAQTDKSSIYHNLFHSKLLLHQFLESQSLLRNRLLFFGLGRDEALLIQGRKFAQTILELRPSVDPWRI